MHEHRRAERTVAGRLLASLCLNAVIALSEIIAGVFSGSVALIADATHNLGDVFALALSLLARTLSSRPPSFRHTYGLKRFEVLAAFLNAAVLVVVAVFIMKHALSRLLHPEPVQAGITILVASVALVANSASVLLLRHHDPHDLNVRSAFFHLHSGRAVVADCSCLCSTGEDPCRTASRSYCRDRHRRYGPAWRAFDHQTDFRHPSRGGAGRNSSAIRRCIRRTAFQRGRDAPCTRLAGRREPTRLHRASFGSQYGRRSGRSSM